jgi:hypothetical protein
MKRPPGLVGALGLCDYGGKLHIPNLELLDWHHARLKTYCGREWPLPKHMRTWADVDADEVCKQCLRSSQVAESVAHETHGALWSRWSKVRKAAGLSE